MLQALIVGSVLSVIYLVFSKYKGLTNSVVAVIFTTTLFLIMLVLVLRMFSSFLQGVL